MINKTMDGYIYNILGEGVEELYWCEKEIEIEIIKTAYKNWTEIEEDENGDKLDFDDWWSEKNPEFYIHRIFLEEVYI
jgi:hypothetical protein